MVAEDHEKIKISTPFLGTWQLYLPIYCFLFNYHFKQNCIIPIVNALLSNRQSNIVKKI